MNSDKNILFWYNSDILRRNITYFLTENGYRVKCCSNTEDVLQMIKLDIYNLMIIDSDEYEDIFDILLKSKNISYIICLRPQNSSITTNKRVGFLPKPFDLSEISEIIQKTNFIEENEKNSIIKLGKYKIFIEKNCIGYGNIMKKIPKQEMTLLLLLLRNMPEIVSKEIISLKIWEDKSIEHSNSINVYTNNLRKYFINDPQINIENIYGKGLRIYFKES